MASLLASIVQWLRSLLFSKHLEICVVGLNAAGKTSLVNVLASGQFSAEMVPTVGFNMRKVQSGNTTIKVWDIGGQPRFRNMWERYCRGVSAIVFVVDSAVPLPREGAVQSSGGAGGATTTDPSDPSTSWQVATEELHALVARPMLAGLPLLVLATKNDVKGAASAEDVIRIMRLETIANREVSCYSISSKVQTNIDVTLRWLCARSPAGAR
ncbi:P-loop containing nucleoside triphosphate hydrolase protein [Ceraceosorus guamensis]|uniref:P-loop containing nucleoside triphosphate hydrolase protein n=1 Tax=Ceraceosorus guamensis TaxID=1522189 RepID=A0A316VYW6_9BASI|nr:P-loop containing nucleoside triphosphate hydrolase protein [Ceraceosorus guamensis]PWN42700.1 P-loop containing nucleoside triphosphate hydrolase protein [Ceraceosorus guamensis]